MTNHHYPRWYNRGPLRDWSCVGWYHQPTSWVHMYLVHLLLWHQRSRDITQNRHRRETEGHVASVMVWFNTLTQANRYLWNVELWNPSVYMNAISIRRRIWWLISSNKWWTVVIYRGSDEEANIHCEASPTSLPVTLDQPKLTFNNVRPQSKIWK